MSFGTRKINKTTIRILVICLVILLYFLVLETRLWQEQILMGSFYDQEISSQSIRRIRKPAPRGRIFTSDKKLLADNVPVFNVVFHLQEMRQPGRKKNTINHIVDSAGKASRVIGRENPLKYDVLFITSRMKQGNLDETADHIIDNMKKIARAKGKMKLPLSRDKILTHLQKYPKRPLMIYKNLEEAEYKRIRQVTPKIKGAILTEWSTVQHINTLPALPMTIFENLTDEEMAKISEMPNPVPGLEVMIIPQRRYKYGKTACHILGFIRKDDPQKAVDRDEYFYYIPDEKGKKGLEKVYDSSIPEADLKRQKHLETAGTQLGTNNPIASIEEGEVKRRGLRGRAGSSLVQVDFRGIIAKTIGNSIQALAGNDIVLTLNFEAQQIAEKLMMKHTGAFVLLDANSGAVIAMVSSPGYDISKFMPKLSRQDWDKLRQDPKKPLLNRATAGEYEPGSIIKPIIALAVQANDFPAGKVIDCRGRSYVGNTSIRCGRRSGHGKLDIVSAIEQSCNVYFIEQGKVLGLEKLAKTMKSFGIGQKTEIPIYERSGLLPSRGDLYYKTGRKWNIFDTALISIGQGNIQVTPLQAALYIAAIANGGTIWRPYLLREMLDPKGNTIYITKPFPKSELKIPPEHLEKVEQGMYNVVHGRHGSGKTANTKSIELYGKTGTAQKGKKPNIRRNTWFAGFGTREGTTYAFAVFVENGDSGGRTCAPIARQFFDTWLKEKKTKGDK